MPPLRFSLLSAGPGQTNKASSCASISRSATRYHYSPQASFGNLRPTNGFFFIESISPDATQVRNVFVSSTENGKVSIVVSSQGHILTQPDGERFVVLENGRRYDGQPGQPDYRIMSFERYGVRIGEQRFVNTPTSTSTSTPQLIRQPSLVNLAELAWRAGLPLIAINLMLLAIPLAYQNPRRSRTINLVMAVLIYLTYSNFLNLMQSWIEQGKISFSVGLCILHLIAAAVVVLLFWLRTRHRPLLSYLSLARSKEK